MNRRHFIRDEDYPDDLRPPFHSPLEAELARFKILLRPAELARYREWVLAHPRGEEAQCCPAIKRRRE